MADSKPPTEDLAGVVRRQVAEALPEGGALRVGYSGGLDSTVLLALLASQREALGLALEAVHVHHGLSPRADDWARHCEAFAASLGVACRVERVAVDRRDPAGLEAAARRARQAVLSAPGVQAVALAHHRDDQAETVLFQALRGTGLKGLAAMGAAREWGGVRWVRPFLDVPRGAIEAEARARGLAWIEDESNASLAFDRNFLRHEAMPMLASRFPQAAGSLARLARHAASAGALLRDLARLDAGRDLGEARLPAANLRALSPERAANVLRHWIEAHGGPMPGEARLAEGLGQLLGARPGAKVRLQVGDLLLRRHGADLVIEADQEAIEGWSVPWRGEGDLALPPPLGRVRFDSRSGEGIAAARATTGDWHFGPRRGGERLRLAPGRPRRTLKNLLQEAGVPDWCRPRLPLLFEGTTLVWVPGLGLSADYAAAPGEPGLEPRWCPPKA